MFRDRAGRIAYELEQLQAVASRVIGSNERIVEDRPCSATFVLPPTDAFPELELEVRYPVLYPYFKFEIFAPDLALNHHQNPFEHNLCLLGRSGPWDPETDTLVTFGIPRLYEVLKVAAMSTSASKGLEEEQAEPITAFYPSFGALFIDGAWVLPEDATHGDILLAGATGRFGSLRKCVVKIWNQDRQVIAEMDSRVASLFPDQLRGQWIRRPSHVLVDDPGVLFERLCALRAYERKNWLATGFGSHGCYVVIAPEEASRREASGQGWIATTVFRPKHKLGKGTPRVPGFFSRADRVGALDRQQRIPELIDLPAKKIAVVGLGSLGAPLALSLAQAGVGEIRVLDFDRIDASTSVRYPLGLAAAGTDKVVALQDFVSKHYPYTKVTPYALRIGGVGEGSATPAQLLEFVDGVDLLVDATAEHNVGYYLGSLALEQRRPLLTVDGTAGGWGGRIFRSRSDGSSACWCCYKQALKSGAAEGGIDPPPWAPADEVQPQGCAEPTFTGAGFDMHTIALTAVRAAVEILTPKYPSASWNTLVIQLRGPTGEGIVPGFVPYSLPRQTGCSLCGSLAAG